MECERRKVYVEVNVTHRPDGTARPNSIKFENDEIYEVDRVMQKCRAAATKVGGTGIRYTVQICGQSPYQSRNTNRQDEQSHGSMKKSCTKGAIERR